MPNPEPVTIAVPAADGAQTANGEGRAEAGARVDIDRVAPTVLVAAAEA